MKGIQRVAVWLVALLLLVLPLSAYTVSAAEDTVAPELISLAVEPLAIEAGQDIRVKVGVKEDGTGLVKALVQFNGGNHGEVMVHNIIEFDKPLYSSQNQLIEQTFTMATTAYAQSGVWYIGYIEFYDQKGNFSRYCANADNDRIVLDGGRYVFDANTHVAVTNTAGDPQKPKMNTVAIETPVVEKPGTLKIRANLSEAASIYQVQVGLSSGSKGFCYQESVMSSADGNGNYVIEIPVTETTANGDWEVTDIRFANQSGNQVHYTSALCNGYFQEAGGLYADKFGLLTFKVTGAAADETAPVINSITVLTPDATVSKPGILTIEVDLVEDGTGVSFVEFMYEIPTALDNPADGSAVANSRDSVYFMLEGEENRFSADTTIVRFASPLKTGKHRFDLPIASVRPSGEYVVYPYRIYDGADNENQYHAERKPRATFTVEDEFEYAFEMGINNPSLSEAVAALEDGGVGRILLGGEKEKNVLPKQLLDEVAGKDKTLVCYRDGFQWIIRGAEIEPSKTKDLNLTMRSFTIDGKNLSSGKKAVGLSFENNGELPGKIEFRVKTAFVKTYFGKEEALRLYHVENSEGGFETDIDYADTDYEEVPAKEANIQVVLEENDAWCYVDLTHNSKYVLSDAKIAKLKKQPTAANTTGAATSGTTATGETTAADTTTSSVSGTTATGVTSVPTTGKTTVSGGDGEPSAEDNAVAVVVVSVMAVLALAVTVLAKTGRIAALCKRFRK